MIASQGTDSFDVLTIPVRSISGQFIKNLEYVLDFFGLFELGKCFVSSWFMSRWNANSVATSALKVLPAQIQGFVNVEGA